MGTLIFIIAAVALASALPGLRSAFLASRAGGWSEAGDGELFWLTWAGDMGQRRLLAAVVLALLVLAACRFLAPRDNVAVRFLRGGVRIFSKWWVAAACVLLAALPLAAPRFVREDPGERPDVILVLLDTVRLDHVGWGGSELDTTPRLDALAAQGVAFTQAISQASWTKPATATLLTGVMPNEHLATTRYAAVPGRLRTLAEAFYSAGYRTGGWSSNPNVGRPFGFHQGFEYWRQDVGEDADVFLDEARGWMEADERPSFVYLHLNDAHYPYNPKPETQGMFNMTGVEAHLDGTTERTFRESLGASMSDLEIESLRLSYCEEIRWLDGVLGDFLEQRLAAGREVIVLITSDHGEEFREHGDLGHGHTLYEELLRVPMQVAWSPELGDKVGFQPGIYDQQVRLLDVVPTLLACTGLDWPATITPLSGRTLTPFLVGRPDGHRTAVSETDSLGSRISGPPGPLRSIRDGDGNKLVITDPWLIPEFADRHWLFDLDADPGEHHNLAGEQPQLREALLEALRQTGWLTERSLRSGEGQRLSETHRAQLAEMGYADEASPEDALKQEPYLDERAVPWWPWDPEPESPADDNNGTR